MSVIVLANNPHCSSGRLSNKEDKVKQKYTSAENVRAFLERNSSDNESNLSGSSLNSHKSDISDIDIEIIGEASVDKAKDSDNQEANFHEDSVDIFEPTRELLQTPQKNKCSDLSTEDFTDEHFSCSPEIPYTGSPVIFKLHKSDRTKIIKQSMSGKTLQARPKKVSVKDISSLLDSDEEIFDKPKRNGDAEGTPSRLFRNTSKISDIESAGSPRIRETVKESPQTEEVSLRMKFRRSTEQSNYKVETLESDSNDRRASLRTTIVLPKRFTSTEMDPVNPTKPTRSRIKKSVNYYEGTSELDNSLGTPKRSHKANGARSSRRTPSRQPKPVQYYEEPSDPDESLGTPKRPTRQIKTPKRYGDSDNEIHTPRTRANQPKTPRSSILKSVAGTPSGRPRRSTRGASIDLTEHEGNENDTNKFNTDESDSELRSGRKRRLLSEEPPMTPKKSVTIVDQKATPKKIVTIKEDGRTPRTPRKSRRLSPSDDEQSTPKKSSKLPPVPEEPVTPKQSSRSAKTPRTPSLRQGSFTPSMHQRSANVGKPKTALQEARAKLHVSAVPKSLPCREEEFNDIFSFLQRKLLEHSSGCIYISGVPGTGKTATVNEVIRCLKKLESKGDLEEFNFLEINGMKLTEPKQAYVQILKQINGQTCNWEQAYQTLEKRFTKSTGHRPMTLLLVDELDLLCNKRQDVVYNLLDWPAKAGAQLVVLTIANTMDLPERVLMGRVTSRLGLTRLTFQPYNHKQLQEIVTTRLKDSDAFRSEAIQLVARKVAAVSGDARRALDICRRATEIAESNEGKIVSMKDVNEALTEMIASAKVQAIKHCSEMEKVFLQAVCAEITRTGVEEATFQNIYKQFEALCSFEGEKTPNVSQTLEICSRLSANRLLLCEHSRMDIMQRIVLNVSADDIHFALQSIEI